MFQRHSNFDFSLLQGARKLISYPCQRSYGNQLEENWDANSCTCIFLVKWPRAKPRTLHYTLLLWLNASLPQSGLDTLGTIWSRFTWLTSWTFQGCTNFLLEQFVGFRDSVPNRSLWRSSSNQVCYPWWLRQGAMDPFGGNPWRENDDRSTSEFTILISNSIKYCETVKQSFIFQVSPVVVDMLN